MFNKLSLVSLAGAILVGLALIIYNSYILYDIYFYASRGTVPSTILAYFPLGLVLIIGGPYIYWLQNKYNQTQKSKEQLSQQRLPRICKLEDESALPPMSSEQLYLMQQLFKSHHKIRVKPLEGGFNNFGVFQVIPETIESRLLKPGYFVKYLSIRDILQEKNVYQPGGVLYEYPLAHTPGRPLRNWPPDQELNDSSRLGAVTYELATLDSDSQLYTLKSLYKQEPIEEFLDYLKLLFKRLERWYGRRLPEAEIGHLGGTDGVYERLYRRRNDIERGIQDLIKPSAQVGDSVFLSHDLDTTAWIKLPYLPESWIDNEFYNPIYWINNVLVPGEARYFKAISRQSPVHGDLHTGNVLVERSNDIRVWLIDFANAHIGPSVQDFATLEADVKFNLIDMKQCSLDDWLKFEEQLLHPLKSGVIGLTWPWSQEWQPEGELLKAWKFIKELRQWVIEYQLIGGDVRAYYLALLHSTLPVVYRKSHDKTQKQCALTSTAWMCRYLTSR